MDLEELEQRITDIREEAKLTAKLKADCALKIKTAKLKYRERNKKRLLNLQESIAKRRRLVAENEEKIQEQEEAKELKARGRLQAQDRV